MSKDLSEHYDKIIEAKDAEIERLRQEFIDAQSQTCSTIFGKPYDEWQDIEAENAELQAEIERLRADVLHWKGMTKGRESEIDQRLSEIAKLQAVVDAAKVITVNTTSADITESGDCCVVPIDWLEELDKQITALNTGEKGND